VANKTYKEKLLAKELLVPGIYKLIINGKIYIGSAVVLSQRLRSHINDLQNNRHKNIHLQRAFILYNEIDFEILEYIPDVNDLIKREQFYIDSLRPHYNIAKIAGSQLGMRHSAETRKKISDIQKGKKVNPESIKRMADANRGVKLSDSHKAKLSASKMGEKNPFYKAGKKHPQYGIPKSEQTKARVSATSKLRGSHRGVNNSSAKSGILYDVDTGANHIFLSLKPLCEKLGIVYKGMHSALKGKRFYKDRYYVDYVQFPKDIVDIHKSNFLKSIDPTHAKPNT
jgi:group I intron endonuclease